MAPTTTTAIKRRASRSPSGRSPKRYAGSSPEEGEVDDGSPGASTGPSPVPSLPQKSSAVSSKPKVAFPFKRKGETTGSHPSLSIFEPKDGPGVYERSAEDDERLRQRTNWRRPYVRDTWGYHNGSPPDRRRRLSPRPLAPRQDSYRSSRSKSPRSHQSRSPSSPPHGGKHRLPPHRSPANYSGFSPLSKGSYNRDVGKGRALYDRNDGDELDRRRDHDSGRNHVTRNDDRFYRPTYANDYHSSSRQDRHRDRDFPRDRDHPRDRDYGRRWEDDYPRHPPSPIHHSMPPPPEPKPNGLPPQPQSSPPPEPPPDVRLIKDTTLPQEHKTVSIALKRPPVSHEGPSSPSHSVPPPSLDDLLERKMDDDRRKEEEKQRDEERTREDEMKQEGRKQDETRQDEKKGNGWKRENQREKEQSKPKFYHRRNVVRRSPEEEMKAYGYKFEGCGLQSDYDVTTKLGEGTFGEVHKAIQKETGRHVALKRILMHNEKEGMPVTALREIKILKALKHPSIIEILDMFVIRSTEKDPLSVYMVFPYMDHDLAGLLENDRVKLQPSQIKLYMKQLLEGTEYMHRNNILHRDMKAANLLISNTGSLRIADFGLARAYDSNVIRVGSDGRTKERKYTNCVVTRWYRPPELLLGARQYGGEVDIWGIGLLTCNPRERITAAEALDHDYFWTDPLPADPKTLPTYEASHEFDKRGQRQQPPPMQHPVNYPSYNIQNNISRNRTGLSVPPPDFHSYPRNQHNHNRHMPYPPRGLPHPGYHERPPPGHHGPPPSDSHPDHRGYPNQPPEQVRYNAGGGGNWRGPPRYDNRRAPGPGDWVPHHPSYLPVRTSAPMGIAPHPGDPGRHGDSSHPPPAGGDDRLNYG
ncbi:hypothetical protein C0992_003246 [Termitomyces sp. T32_za158]|nr:hypothetical protein C0992_003246 [Termitomyces sp. T32_za158]